jgi:hypothetical protein
MTMNAITLRRIALGSAGIALGSVAIVLSVAAWAAQEGVQRPHSRAEFMRLKLDYSKKVLEGLTLEDYENISKNAKLLKRLSQAAEWEVPTIPNATDYLVYTNEFQRLADELAKNAKEKNLDGATLAYVRMTLNCVNCHKYVRGMVR